ncbi:MAG TPA: ATP-binding protein [Pyrinomonadaceae bacterium]|nr:ATP-binding protein [Pyrinomonadaceae bacterium]
MRPKSFLTYFLLCAIPLFLLAELGYWNSTRSIDASVGTIAQNDLNAFSGAVDELLDENQKSMRQLAIAPAARDVVNRVESETAPQPPLPILNSLPKLGSSLHELTLYDHTKNALWNQLPNGEWAYARGFNQSVALQPDEHVWTQLGNVCLEQLHSPSATLQYTVPIHDEKGTIVVGAAAAVLDLASVFYDASHGLPKSNQHSLVVVLDRSGRTLYNSDRLRERLPVYQALPGFNSISNAMTANQSGVDQYHSPSGTNYQVAYAPLPRLNAAVAIARNSSDMLSTARKWGLAGFGLALLTSLLAAFVLETHVRSRSKGIAQVTKDVSAIAKGELDRRIILQSSDDARGLADNINVVTERLRAQIAREEESRQFESFIRISAMLTHDLKNAIEGLSLTVRNMERHFDNPQFRSDALKGLTTATDKLKALVARLSRPLTSLSGEHKRPRNIDLIPIIQRVLSTTAEPLRGKHTIVTRLPANLYAFADEARVEEIIENLVLNALEAMTDGGGTLTVEASQTENGAATFSVKDTGRGMSRSFIETRLFRPFSTTKRTGIGLGLYTCREVIKASGGSIEVDSVEGAGTTFRVVLPSIPHDRRS